MTAATVLLPCKAQHLCSCTESLLDVDESAASAAVESAQSGLAGEESRADAAWALHSGSSSHALQLYAADALNAVRPMLVATDALIALRRLTDSDYWRSFDHAAELEVVLSRSRQLKLHSNNLRARAADHATSAKAKNPPKPKMVFLKHSWQSPTVPLRNCIHTVTFLALQRLTNSAMCPLHWGTTSRAYN